MDKIQITSEQLTDIRKTFDFGFGEIIVYEPTQKMIDEYYDFIESINNNVGISGVDLIKTLIPLFTNLEISEEFLEENAYKLVDEPPLWLRKVQSEVSVIVNELSVLKVMSLKNTINQVSILDNLSEEDIKKYKNIDLKSVESKMSMLDIGKEKKIKDLEAEIEKLKG